MNDEDLDSISNQAFKKSLFQPCYLFYHDSNLIEIIHST